MLVYKGKIGFVQLMLVFTLLRMTFLVQWHMYMVGEKNHLKSMQSNLYDTRHAIIKQSVLMKERT